MTGTGTTSLVPFPPIPSLSFCTSFVQARHIGERGASLGAAECRTKRDEGLPRTIRLFPTRRGGLQREEGNPRGRGACSGSPTPPTPDRCAQGKKQPARRCLFVSPSSFRSPRSSWSWSFFPASRIRARRFSRSVVPLLAAVRLKGKGSSQREEAEWARPLGDLFVDFKFVN